MNQVKLSDRVRPNSEVAAWVHLEIQALENALAEQAGEIERLQLTCNDLDDQNDRIYAELAALKTQPSGVLLPDGWVQLTIEHEPGYPEDVAFGPQRMMDRLKKWLDRYFEMRLNSSPVTAGGVDDRVAFEAWMVEVEGVRIKPRFDRATAGPFAGDYRDGQVQGAWNVWQARAAISANHSEQVRHMVPEGYVLVPERMHLDAKVIGAINYHCGDGQEETGYGAHADGLLWIGFVEDDDGVKSYGLNIATAEYPEEGSTQLVEFAAAPSAGSQKGDE